MHRIHSWAKAHASTPNTQSQGQNQSNFQSSEDASAQDAQVKEGIRDPACPESEKDANQTPERGLFVRMKDGIVRFTGHTKRALCHSWVNVLLVFVPVGIAVEAAGLNPGLIFAMNAIAIIPLAGLLSHATECVASRLGDTVGALINVTFGNAVELIIFIIALVKNEIRIVQASLLGSILANLLLILGMAFLLGGLRFQEQIYNSTVTQMSACLLSLSVMSLLLPTAFHASWSDSGDADKYTLKVSRGTSVVLLLVYVLYIIFQLKSHAYLYASIPQQIIDEESHPGVLAEFMNSSSDSSSSSDESVDTTTSWSTAKRIKRAMKHRRHRKSSTSSHGTVSPQSFRKKSSADMPPAAVIDEHAGSAGDLSVTQADGSGSFVIDFGDDSRYDADHEPQTRDFGQEQDKASKEDRKTKRRERRKQRRAEKDKAATSVTGTTVTGRPSMKTHNTETALDHPQPTLEVGEATEPAKRRSPFRPTIPSLLSNTVFSSNLAAPNSTVPASPSNPYGLRRTHSLPSFTNRPPPPGNAVQFARGASRMPTAVTNNPTEAAPEQPEPEMSRTAAVVMLLVSTGLVAVCAEFLVDAIPTMIESSSVSEAFIGLIILPIVGNAAEHVTAVSVATKNKMDLAIGVSVGSSIQIAIFVTPLVVILGWCMDKDMSLYFTLFETICLFVTAFVVNFLVLDGRSNYLEGSLLIAAYVIIGVAAFYYPGSGQSSDLGTAGG
ncbi:hypothetical protein CBS147321_5958 [Aspergillus niger]|nr:hypothetical protein CBS147321_5958 [Aspergillus niger]